MDPMTLSLLLAGIGGGTNIIGNLLNRPQAPSFDPNKIAAMLRALAEQRGNERVTQANKNLGPALAARGITGGAAGQVIGDTEAGIRGQEEANLTQMLANLYATHAQLQDAYRANKADWLGGVFNDIGSTVGGIGGFIAQQENMKRINEILRNAYGSPSGQSVSNPQTSLMGGMSSTSFADSRHLTPLGFGSPLGMDRPFNF